jgi:SpoVK/Ycf46/Vps4 family AAA+-type ATPase
MSDYFRNYGKPKSTSGGRQKQHSNLDDSFFENYPVSSEKFTSSEVSPVANAYPSQHVHNRSTKEQSGEEDSPDLDSSFAELNLLTGLDLVKSEIHQLIQFVKIQNLRQKSGLGATSLSLHSVFYGSPGTGKTTVARIYGRMLRALGLLRRGHLIETDRAGLVANYVGQTANKTDEKINEAMGGILFIDEAYSLHKGDHAQWDYGSEAIEILMKRMEDNRNDLAVIVAGYPDPMDNFLNSNEGFKSRFVNYIHFEDYTPDELTQIFVSLCDKNNYLLSESALDLSKELIESTYARREKSFGNARFCRKIFEKIIRNQALRVGETTDRPTDDQLRAIEGEDVYPLMNS